LAELIRAAIRYNGVVTAYVYGPFGYGKTSYALWTAYEVLGSWSNVLKHLFFHPKEVIDAIGKAIESGRRLPIIIMDDAGLWLDRLTWWEPDKVAFMEFFNLIRSVAAGVIFTTPTEELPKQIVKKAFIRVSVTPVSEERARALLGNDGLSTVLDVIRRFKLSKLLSLATGYKLRTLPSFMDIVRKEFYDIYPLHYPIHKEYEDKRRRALRTYFRQWKAKVEASKFRSKDDLIALAKELINSGKPKVEVAKELMKLGVPRSTAYYWIKRLTNKLSE